MAQASSSEISSQISKLNEEKALVGKQLIEAQAQVKKLTGANEDFEIMIEEMKN